LRIMYYVGLSMVLASILMPTVVVGVAGQVVIYDNHLSYVDRYGLLRVVGEVENAGNISVESVIITANFYDSQGTIVETSHTFAMLSILPPRTKTPFKITVTTSSPDLISRINRYTLNATFQESKTELMKTLLLLSNDSHTDGFGLLHITGEVQNNGTLMSSYTEVISTCYGEDGKVVAANSVLTSPHRLDPGQKAIFDITVTDENIVPYEIVIIGKNQSANISRYEIMAVSKEAILVPEFSSTVAIMLVICLSASVMILKRKPDH